MKILLSIAVLALLGCGTKGAQTPVAKKPDERAPAAKATPEATPSVEERLAELQARVMQLEVDQQEGRSISIDCTTRDFERLITNNGFLLVACSDAIAALDGFKVRLQIGNPLNVKYLGLALDLRWAANPMEVFFNPPRAHRKEVQLTEEFPPGQWTNVEIMISPATVKELKNLRLSATTNQLALRAAK